jgi:N-acylneuraminate cytidylyltransferase
VKNLAIIPARGNSKRIPRKNIRDFLGKPIISYPIQTARATGLFDEIMVSTDDEGIARLAEEYGAVVPFMRSGKNADDHAVLRDVVREVLGNYRSKGREFDNYCMILPTAVLLTKERIIQGYEKLVRGEYSAVMAVVRNSYPVFRSLTLDDSGCWQWLFEEYATRRSQDLPETYHDAGQFYWRNIASFFNDEPHPCKGTIILNEMEAHDIDTEEDWKIAEMKYRLLY